MPIVKRFNCKAWDQPAPRPLKTFLLKLIWTRGILRDIKGNLYFNLLCTREQNKRKWSNHKTLKKFRNCSINSKDDANNCWTYEVLQWNYNIEHTLSSKWEVKMAGYWLYIHIAWVSGISGGKGGREKPKRERAPPPPSKISSPLAP